MANEILPAEPAALTNCQGQPQPFGARGSFPKLRRRGLTGWSAGSGIPGRAGDKARQAPRAALGDES
jgi:hypothetical protein